MSVGPVQTTRSFWQTPCCAPVRWVSDKIAAVARAIFGYLVRIITFQLGEMRTRGASTIIRIYQKFTYDPRDAKPFDPKRLEESRKLLLAIGGQEVYLTPDDRGARIHCMTFKSADFYRAFTEAGAELWNVQYKGKPRRVFLNPPPFAEKFYLPIIPVTMPNGQVVKGALLPEAPPHPGERKVIHHSHSPGRSFLMERRAIALFLASGIDVAVYDPRGTVHSTGTASEGGYYLDADRVYRHLLSQNYRHNQIFASGYCEGGACAAYLKKKYHDQGVHFIGSNLYTSMKDVVEARGWIGRIAAKYGLPAIQDPKLNVEQDFFDNVNKFKRLRPSAGSFIIMHTTPDYTVGPASSQTIFQAIGGAGPVHEIGCVENDTAKDGHMTPPYQKEYPLFRLLQAMGAV